MYNIEIQSTYYLINVKLTIFQIAVDNKYLHFFQAVTFLSQKYDIRKMRKCIIVLSHVVWHGVERR